jgi:hypothetical protein
MILSLSTYGVVESSCMPWSVGLFLLCSPKRPNFIKKSYPETIARSQASPKKLKISSKKSLLSAQMKELPSNKLNSTNGGKSPNINQATAFTEIKEFSQTKKLSTAPLPWDSIAVKSLKAF